MTQVEIAEKLGISVMTVSRALDPEKRSKVAKGTLDKIDAAVKKYGYTPNSAAKSLRKSMSKTVGVALPYLPGIFYSNYYNHILAGVSDYFRDSDYRFKLLMVDDDKEKWNNFDFRAGEHIDGLILCHWFRMFSNNSYLENLNIPTVVINDVDSSVEANFVATDNEFIGCIAAEYLYQNGHREIAVIAGPGWSKDSEQRVNGFIAFLSDKGIAISKTDIYNCDFLENSAYILAKDIFASDVAYTAVFTLNDQMAYGLMRYMNEVGKTCPDDVSIIGCDDDPLSAMANPPLSTIDTAVYELAQIAAVKVHSILQGKLKLPQGHNSYYLKPKLVARASVKSI